MPAEWQDSLAWRSRLCKNVWDRISLADEASAFCCVQAFSGMGAIRTAFLALLCSLILVPQALLQQTAEEVYPGVQALLLLKASLDPTFTGLPSWDPATNPCTWQGLTCNAQGVIIAM